MSESTRTVGCAASPRLIVVVRDGTVSVPILAGGEAFGILQPKIVLSPLALRMVELIARRPGTGLEDAIAEIASDGAESEHLREVAGRLVRHGLLLEGSTAPGGEAAEIPAALTAFSRPPEEPVVVPDVTMTTVLRVPTPRVLRVTSDGFVMVDHSGRTCLTLDAAGVLVLRALSETKSLRDANMHQRIAYGDHGLGRPGIEAIARQLLASGEARVVDGEELDEEVAQDPARVASEVRARLEENVRREVARVRAEADERGARLGHRLIQVLPVTFLNDNIPLSLGLIFSYAKEYEGGKLNDLYEFSPRWSMHADELESLLDRPTVAMFSNYVWTHGHCLDISARIKAISPQTVTVHGGPDTPRYPADVEQYFRLNPHVDVTVHGEGEATAAEMLDALAPSLLAGQPDLSALADVAGLSYRDGDTIVHTASRDRIADLDTIPSPYLTGEFDAFRGVPGMAGIFESNRGCPYGCTFCDWGSATLSRIRKFDLDRVLDELTWMADAEFVTFGNADANFGIFARDVDIARHSVELKAKTGFPLLFGANYAKNTVKHLRPIIEMLAEGGILSYGILSLQTMDTDTLEVVKRKNIKLEKYDELAVAMNEARLPLFVDLMLGLPGQTLRSFRRDLQECIDREVQARIAPTELLVNSPMNDPEYRERHGIELSSSPVKTARDTSSAFVVASESFTREDRQRMMQLRQLFLLTENFGILRQVARYVRADTGTGEVEFLERLLDTVRAEPDRWPATWVALEVLPTFMAPPGSWAPFLAEVRSLLVGDLGVTDDSALATVLAVQHALLPDRARRYPEVLDLPHDYASWFEDMVAAKWAGHRHDWPDAIVPLRDRPPATFVVDDPAGNATGAIGAEFWGYGFGLNWEMDSPVARSFLLSGERSEGNRAARSLRVGAAEAS